MIDLIRHPERWPRFGAAITEKRFYLSAVVMTELYAGTRSRDESAILDRILRSANRIHQVLTPTVEDWVLAGRLIARRIRLYGQFEARHHLAAVLIVVSTARVNGEVVSANVRHMTGWIDLARRNGLDVTLSD
jgi:predicted nucleic acid-binding protein